MEGTFVLWVCYERPSAAARRSVPVCTPPARAGISDRG